MSRKRGCNRIECRLPLKTGAAILFRMLRRERK
jgi:hypothetical protein